MKLKVGSYNLFNGAKGTYMRLVRFVNGQNFDVLCLQEVNGWQDNEYARAQDFIDQTEFKYYAFGSGNTEYSLVIFSKLPITAQTVHVAGFWHCVIEAHLDVDGTELVVCNAHLNPWNESSRIQEIEHLLAKLDLTKPTLVAGDLNSLSRGDNYPAGLLRQLISLDIMKFGQSEIEYRVMDRLSEVGFVDSAAQLGTIKSTVPTNFSTDQDHEIPVRIDYILVNALLVGSLLDFMVLKLPEADVISDHYPIALILDTQLKPTDELTEPSEYKAQIEPEVQVENQDNPTEVEIRLR